jgi:hypothetical protein
VLSRLSKYAAVGFLLGATSAFPQSFLVGEWTATLYFTISSTAGSLTAEPGDQAAVLVVLHPDGTGMIEESLPITWSFDEGENVLHIAYTGYESASRLAQLGDATFLQIELQDSTVAYVAIWRRTK